jgi:hypothetical protein
MAKMKAIIALFAALALVGMHQLGGLSPALATPRAADHSVMVAHQHQMSSEMGNMEMKDETAHKGLGHSGGAEKHSSCATNHDVCQALAAQDFSLPIAYQPLLICLRATFATAMNAPAARQERSPPERASLSIWRI